MNKHPLSAPQNSPSTQDKESMKKSKSIGEQPSQYYLIMALSLAGLLGGCGGGGDGGGESTPTPTTSTTTTTDTGTGTDTGTDTGTTTPDPTPDPTSLDDLVIAEDNIIESAYQLAIEVAMDDIQRAYFSVCDDYQTSGNGYIVNYDSCLFRGPLSKGLLSANIKVANHQDKLMAVIWHYDGSDPSYQLWQYDFDAESQRFMVN